MEADRGCRFSGRQLKAMPADGFHFLSKVRPKIRAGGDVEGLEAQGEQKRFKITAAKVGEEYREIILTNG